MAYFQISRSLGRQRLLSGGLIFGACSALSGLAAAAQGQASAADPPGKSLTASAHSTASAEAESDTGSDDASQDDAASATAGIPKNNAPVDLTATSSVTLDSDLRIVLHETIDSPTVSVCTAIDAGSRRDPIGAPGAYRVLAEILKDGGYRSATQDYPALVASRGGVNQVTVTREATTFCTTVPSSELPLALWTTAGRFTAGALTQEALRKAVDALAEEAELEDSEVRAGRVPERLRKMAFLGNYEYSHPTLPNPDDLDAISLETIRTLHEQSYVARRSVVVLSGGFESEAAKPLFAQHLYAARPGTAAPDLVSHLVVQHSERFSMAEDQSAKTPAAWYGWVAPSDKDREAMNLALSILTSKKRLGGQLVGSGRAATSLDLHLDESRYGYGLARLEIVGSNSRSLGTIEQSFDAQLRALAAKDPTPSELAEAQEALREAAAAKLETPLARSATLAEGVLLGQSPRQILAPLDPDYVPAELSPERVRLAAASLLSPEKRSAVEIYPKGWQDPWQQPMRQYHIVEAGQTLGSIANIHGTSVAVITQMNKINASKPIYPGDKLRVPRNRTAPAKKPRSHQVRRGDTLSGLAVKYGVGVSEIMGANGMGSKQTIRSGETLIIPWASKSDSKDKSSSSSSSSSDSSSTYKVSPGDTLSGIAAKQGVSTVALARANGISHKAMVKVGQILKVPPRGTGKSSASGVPVKLITYTVKKGDTLSGIARRHGVSVAELTVANQMSRKSTLRPGQVLNIPPKK